MPLAQLGEYRTLLEYFKRKIFRILGQSAEPRVGKDIGSRPISSPNPVVAGSSPAWHTMGKW